MSTLDGIHTLRKIVMSGDKVLVRPTSDQHKTRSGLYLPPTVTEKEDIQQGVVVKVGPGFPIPAANDEDEPWKEKKESLKYIPLQVQEQDQVLFLRRNGHDVEIDGEKYLIIPHSAILLMVREDELSELGL